MEGLESCPNALVGRSSPSSKTGRFLDFSRPPQAKNAGKSLHSDQEDTDMRMHVRIFLVLVLRRCAAHGSASLNLARGSSPPLSRSPHAGMNMGLESCPNAPVGRSSPSSKAGRFLGFSPPPQAKNASKSLHSDHKGTLIMIRSESPFLLPISCVACYNDLDKSGFIYPNL